jgi:hypothetical protein
MSNETRQIISRKHKGSMDKSNIDYSDILDQSKTTSKLQNYFILLNSFPLELKCHHFQQANILKESITWC